MVCLSPVGYQGICCLADVSSVSPSSEQTQILEAIEYTNLKTFSNLSI